MELSLTRRRLEPLPALRLLLAERWDAGGHHDAMNGSIFPLNEVLIGSLGPDCDPDDAVAQLSAGGVAPARVLLLRRPADLDALRGTGRSGGVRGRLQWLLRTIDDLDERGAGQVLRRAAEALRVGRPVVVVREVGNADAAEVARSMVACGMSRPRYLGRWTVLEGGRVPSADGASIC